MASSGVSRKRFHLSLYAIIPAIFAGIAVLSSLIAFRLAEHYFREGKPADWPVYFWSLSMALFTFLCGFLVVYLLLKPVQGFLEKARDIPLLSGAGVDGPGRRNLDRLEQYNRVFEQVTTVLSKVDVRQLFPEIIGESRKMRAVLAQVVKVAPEDSTVLIMGDSGTGKELIATAIHAHGRRRDKPLVMLNCAAIPEGLLESELFGHEKGAFTGAASTRKGKFELASGGTLFLDEIGDMPPGTQAKILRALQSREFERVGGSTTIRVDVRIIAATNKNLEKMTETGLFREDLYYRLNVISLFLPALRDRAEDIPLLVNHFLKRFKPEQPMLVSAGALRQLMAYDWPGNVRELRNVVERALVMAEGDMIEITHLPPEIGRAIILTPQLGEKDHRPFSLDEHLRDMEMSMIVEALKNTQGVQVKAAELLGINQRSLWHRIKKHNIDVNVFKTYMD